MGEAYWRGAIRRRHAGGLTVSEFCRQEGVSTAAYYNWQKRLREQDETSPLFVPVCVSSAEPAARGSQPACLEIVLSGGVVIRVPDGTAAETITHVLRSLEAVSC